MNKSNMSRRLALLLSGFLLAAMLQVNGATLFAQATAGQAPPAQGYDAQQALLKDELSKAKPADVPSIIERTFTQLSGAKTGSFRIHDVVSVRPDESIPVLIRMASDDEHPNHSDAEWVLRDFLPDSAPLLANALATDDAATRHMCVRVLQVNAWSSEPSQQALQQVLGDSDPYVRHVAAIGLISHAAFGEQARKILTAEYDQLGEHKLLALRSLLLFASANPDARELALRLVGDPDTNIRVETGLGLFGAGLLTNEELLPALIDSIDAGGAHDKFSGVMKLASLGPAAQPALEKLTQVAEPDSAVYEELRLAAQLAVCCIDREQIPTRLPAIVSGLSMEANLSPARRADMLLEVAQLGTDAQSAVPALETMFAADDEREHVEIALVVLQIDGDGPERGLALLREVIAGRTPNPNTLGYDWKPIAATAPLAEDLTKAMQTEHDVKRLRQLTWIWTNVLPRETAEMLKPRAEQIMAAQEEPLNRVIANAILRLEQE